MGDWDKMRAEAAARNAEKTTIRGTVIERYELDNKGFAPAPIALIRDDETGVLVEIALFGFRGQYINVGSRMETTALLVEGSQPDRKATKRDTGTRVLNYADGD